MPPDAELTLIGYWLGPYDLGWPDVRKLVDPQWDVSEREATIAHLRSGREFRYYLGLSFCRICNCTNGATELTDGTYCWPVGLAHYLEKHDVSLPRRFVEHVLQGRKVRPKVRARDLKRATVYYTWWKGQTWQKERNDGSDRATEFLEILRQELAYVTFFGDAPLYRKAMIEQLGRAGEYLLRALDELQREHEARYGPQAPAIEHPPFEDVAAQTRREPPSGRDQFSFDH